MEGDELLFLSVKNTADGQLGALGLTKGATIDFRTNGADPQTGVFSIQIASLSENKIFTKKDSAQVRLAGEKGAFVFEFPTKSESQRFLSAVGAAIANMKSPSINHASEKESKKEVTDGHRTASTEKSARNVDLAKVIDDDYRASPKSISKSQDAISNNQDSKSSPKSTSKSPESIPTNNFGQAVSRKPFVRTTIDGYAKVMTDLTSTDIYVVFLIRTESNLPEYKSERKNSNGDYVCFRTTRHRYSEFESLREELMRKHLEAAVPALPPKSFAHKFSPSFLNERGRELTQFISSISSNARLLSCPELVSFLTIDPHAKTIQVDDKPSADQLGSSPSGWDSYFIDTKFASVLENVAYSVWSSPTTPNQHFETQMELDYFDVLQLSKKYNITADKLPFQKFVVLALGTTSAGKSSFINHFYGLGVKKEADAQQDVCFTIVEVVPSAIFEKYTPAKAPSDAKNSYPQFSAAELSKNVEDVYTDKRYNYVFTYLDTASTLNRYQTQLDSMKEQVSKFNLFQCVLINEYYLQHNSPTSLATRTILIDSPGFNSDTLNGSEIVDRFIGNLRILQSLYSLADQTLYFIPATHLNMVSNQLQIFELSLLYSVVGADQMERIIHSSLNRDDKHKASQSSGLFSSVMKNLKKAISGNDDAVVYKGTSIWEKTFFVMSKIDLLQNQEDALRHVYYELGGLFAKSFVYLPNPVADSILTLSLPSRSHSQVQSQLYSLTEKLKAKANQSPYEKRVEVAIQHLCSLVEKAINASWSKLYSNDGKSIAAINSRSQLRFKSLVK